MSPSNLIHVEQVISTQVGHMRTSLKLGAKVVHVISKKVLGLLSMMSPSSQILNVAKTFVNPMLTLGAKHSDSLCIYI